MQNVNNNFIFFGKNHYLLLSTQQWRVNDVNIADTREQLFVPISKKTTLLQNSISSFVVHNFKPHFACSFQMKQAYWTLVYINSSFSLTHLLTMFWGVTFYLDTL